MPGSGKAAAQRKAVAPKKAAAANAAPEKAASAKAAPRNAATGRKAALGNAATGRKAAVARTTAASKPGERVSTHPVKQRTAVSEAIIERLREICEVLPDTSEKVSWGEPTWRVRGKIYAQVADRHHGNEHVAVWLPAPDGAQAALIDSDPQRFFRPPYVGPRGWIGVVLDTKPDWNMVAALIAQAHELIARKR